MNKIWKVIGAVVLIAVLLGTIFIGVGFLTGGDFADIMNPIDDVLESNLLIQNTWTFLKELYNAFRSAGVF